MSKVLIICLFILPFSYHLQGQELTKNIVASSGDNYQSSGYSIQWTLGETAVTEYFNENTNLTEGFHSMWIGFNGSVSTKFLEGLEQIDIFPNPSSEFIEYKLPNNSTRITDYKIYNFLGKKVNTQAIELGKINIAHLQPSTYYIVMKTNNKEIYSGRFIKI